MAAPFSAIMMVGELVLPEVIVGITDASTTRRPATPRTRRRAVDDGHRIAVDAHPGGPDRVEDRGADIPRRRDQLRVGRQLRAGPQLLRRIAGHGRLPHDPPHDPDRIGRDLAVLRRRQIVGRDHRRGRGVARPRMDRAAAAGAEIAHAGGDRRERMHAVAELVERQRLDVHLQVGRLVLRRRAGEGAELRRRHGHRPAPQQGVFGPHQAAAQQRPVLHVQRRDVGDLEDRPQLQVILQVLADARQVVARPRSRAAAAARRRRCPIAPAGHGVATAPVETMTSARARSRRSCPSWRRTTPVARPSSTTTRSAIAWVKTARFGRFSAGCRNPRAALQRRPRFWLTSK